MPVSTSAAATVLTVPSPPPATISGGRRATALPTAATISSPPCASSISACRPAAWKWPASRSTSAWSLPPPEPALTMTTIASEVMAVSERPRALRRARRCGRRERCAAPERGQRAQAERQPGDAFGECGGDVAQVVDAEVHARERDERDRAGRGDDDGGANQRPARSRERPGDDQAVHQRAAGDVAAREAVARQRQQRIVEDRPGAVEGELHEDVERQAAGDADEHRREMAPLPAPGERGGDDRGVARDGDRRVQVGDEQHPARHLRRRVRAQPARDLDVEHRQAIAGDDVFGDGAEQPCRGDQHAGRRRRGAAPARPAATRRLAATTRRERRVYMSRGSGSTCPLASRGGVAAITPQAIRAPELPVGCVV